MDTFYTETFINAPVSRVWEAFVAPDQFFKAFYQADIRSTFKVGDRIEYAGLYEGKETVHIYGEVLAYEPKKFLSYTDHPGPMYHADHAKLESRVSVGFEETGSATRISITNDQFSPDNPMRQEAKQWYLILSNLKSWIETGQLMNLQAH